MGIPMGFRIETTRASRPLLPALLLALWTAAVLIGAGPLAAAAAEDTEVYAFSDRYPVQVRVLGEMGAQLLFEEGIDFDRVELPEGPGMPGLITAYVNDRERGILEAAGLTVTPVPNEGKRGYEEAASAWREVEQSGRDGIPQPPGSRDWPTYPQLEAELQAVAAAHPELVHLITIGNTIQGRAIWLVKISDNPAIEEMEPEFKFTSSIHGDEVTGLELCRRMIHHLVDNYGTDPSITNLVDGAELWFCPMHNPDGFARGSRYNANGQDLNREFPDPVTDPHDTIVGREPENQHFMNFGYGHNFILSANYHGGALVMNIPWDCRTTQTPDHNMLWQYAEGYSYRNPPMWNSTQFYHGVTLGGLWYIIHGGMQDWCYEWRNEMDITIEVSTTKWPNYTTMDTYWNNNRDSMLWYMERVLYGVKGRVFNAVTQAPVSATVMAVEIGKAIKSDPDLGDFHRMLLPGTYTLRFTAEGYDPLTVPGVTVTDLNVTWLDVPMYPVGTSVAENGGGARSRAWLSSPEPNPVAQAGRTARMDLRLAQEGSVSAAVFDVAGRQVRTLLSGAKLGAGVTPIAWDTRTDLGGAAGPGVYFVRVSAGGSELSRRVVVLGN